MKKVNGYIDLEEHFKEITKKDKIDQYYLEDKKIIKPSNTGTSAMFWFKYMDVNILFKAFNNEYSIYSELVSEELATELGLPNALYDMAKFQKYTGVITYDYKKIEYEYINLGRILTFYLENVLINENNKDTYKHKLVDNSDINSLDLLNNLEDIWNALEFYLYNNKFLHWCTSLFFQCKPDRQWFSSVFQHEASYYRKSDICTKKRADGR